MSLALGTTSALHRRTAARLSGRASASKAAEVGWEAALLEVEHQAEHWDTPEHGEVGHLIGQALRAAVDIARSGGLHCEHRGGSPSVPDSVLRMVEGRPTLKRPEAQQPPSAA